MSNLKNVTDVSFEADVIDSELPVLVDFWAEWCGPCKALMPTLEKISVEYDGKVSFMKVNVDENPSMRDKLSVRGIPTMILFNEGREVARSVGAKSVSQLSRFLDAQLGIASEISARGPISFSAFGGNIAFKEAALSRLRAHVAAKVAAPDELMWDEPLIGAFRVAVNEPDIEKCLVKLGFPEEVAVTAERLASYQGTHLNAAKYIADWLDSVPVGCDLQPVASDLVVRALKTTILDDYIAGDSTLRSLCDRLISLHLANAEGKTPEESEWRSVREACDALLGQAERWRHHAVASVFSFIACAPTSDSHAVAGFIYRVASLRRNELLREIPWAEKDDAALNGLAKKIAEAAQSAGEKPPHGSSLLDRVAEVDPQLIERFRVFQSAGAEEIKAYGKLAGEMLLEATRARR